MKFTLKRWSLYWAARVTKWKGFGLELSLSGIHPYSVIGWDFSVRNKIDHPGVQFSLDILWLHFEFEFVDSRHWSPSMKQLIGPEDEEAGIRDFSPSYEPSEVIEFLYEEFGKENIFSVGLGLPGTLHVYLSSHHPDLEEIKSKIPNKYYGWEIQVSELESAIPF